MIDLLGSVAEPLQDLAARDGPHCSLRRLQRNVCATQRHQTTIVQRKTGHLPRCKMERTAAHAAVGQHSGFLHRPRHSLTAAMRAAFALSPPAHCSPCRRRGGAAADSYALPCRRVHERRRARPPQPPAPALRICALPLVLVGSPRVGLVFSLRARVCVCVCVPSVCAVRVGHVCVGLCVHV